MRLPFFWPIRRDKRLSDMESIILNSPVNGGYYDGEKLPTQPGWEWPKGTFLERRREQLKEEKKAKNEGN